METGTVRATRLPFRASVLPTFSRHVLSKWFVLYTQPAVTDGKGNERYSRLALKHLLWASRHIERLSSDFSVETYSLFTSSEQSRLRNLLRLGGYWHIKLCKVIFCPSPPFLPLLCGTASMPAVVVCHVRVIRGRGKRAHDA